MTRSPTPPDPSPPAATLEVVVGLIADARGRVLVGQRLPGTHMAGFWEFPGGKRHPGESPRRALERELREELGIRVLSADPFTVLHHAYPDRHVRLDVWRVEHYDGEPAGCEDQPLTWARPEELRDLPLLPADEPIVALLMAGAG